MRDHGRLVREAPNVAMPAPTSIAAAPENLGVLRFRDCKRGPPKLGSSWANRRTILETLLYRPVKTFLEGFGFVVKGEIGGCDLFALRGDDPPFVVIGELKLTFNLELVLQGVDRAAMRRSLARRSPFVAREGA
jgi:hypothetical protein